MKQCLSRWWIWFFALVLLASRADAAEHIFRYDTDLRLLSDGSLTATRTLDLEFLQPEDWYRFSFTAQNGSGDYTYSYRYRLVSGEVDSGRGFQRVPSYARELDGYWYVYLQPTEGFRRHVKLRLETQEWGDTFSHEGGMALGCFAVPSATDDGTLSTVTVELPVKAAADSRYVFVKGPTNSIDGVMVSRFSPQITVPGEYDATFEAPNRAKFELTRPMGRSDHIRVAVYMPSNAVRETKIRGQNLTTSAERVLTYTVWYLVGFGVISAVVALIVLTVVLAKRRPPMPPPRLT